VPLLTQTPTFEPGVWMGIDHDAVQKISADGILECWEQGCQLLGGTYRPQLLSVHDADEYLAAADSVQEEKRRMRDVLDAYQALQDLKAQGKTQAIGIGAKNWRVIRDISRATDLDWVMLAVSFTIFSHPPELIDFMDELAAKGIGIINSAVFHAGFLTGGSYFDYRLLDEQAEEDRPYFEWRDRFFKVCARFQVSPAAACIQFGLSHPGVLSIALNTSKPGRIRGNIESITTAIAASFWRACKEEGLIHQHYPYLG
ncbi:MAG: aldo/keto reductase, partial [Calditrichaeota bacterium]